MKNTIKLAILSLLFVACQQKIKPSDISKINGYWEIEKVVFPDGTKKEYKMNETYDFFNIANNKGFRKKVTPQLDGTFLVNNSSEAIKVLFEKDKTFLAYATPYSKWNEELITLTDEKMEVVNPDKITYFYKKTAPINLTSDGKTTK
jgi:hypothetical protein